MRVTFVTTILLCLTACFSFTVNGYVCFLKKRWDPSVAKVRWSMLSEDRCFCQGVVAPEDRSYPACPMPKEAYKISGEFWYTDHPGPLTRRENWTPDILDSLLERVPFCDIKVCLSNPCQNGGTCVDGTGTYTCSCRKGYSGKQCEIEINECESSPCQNGGTCIDDSGSFFCSCVEGYDGDMCDKDINECDLNPCQNGGTCIDRIGSFECVCPAGYEGEQCQNEVNECDSHPCQNGGTCVDRIGSFECHCPAGYEGEQCQDDINECDSNPCQNGGTCVDQIGSFECRCPAGHEGAQCENINMLACVTNTCDNGGVCVNDTSTGTVSCICQTGYGGSICDKDVESVFITVFNSKQLSADTSPFYMCYQTAGETTPRTYGRYVNTRDDTSQYQTPIPRDHPQETNAQIIDIPSNNNNGFGIFYCRGTQPNKKATTVLTILLSGGAKVHPKGGLFTKTVNKGEVGVTLEVEDVNWDDWKESEIRWMFNGTESIGSPSFTYTISDPVFAANEGVYEAYYNGKRDEQKHAIMRLIVRDCAPSRWGPPSCSGICDKCYNGGVCDDKSGKCICPPGFMGDNCLTACGGNAFGKNCEFHCTETLHNDGSFRDGACRGWEVCLPDPYGCTCNTGFYDLDCNDACEQNTFGASCTQDCHCASGECNQYTGACEGAGISCLGGWTGETCQIPDVCENGYYSHECTEKCHCLNNAACVKITGECPDRQCAPGYQVYSGSVNCQN